MGGPEIQSNVYFDAQLLLLIIYLSVMHPKMVAKILMLYTNESSICCDVTFHIVVF